MFGVTKHHSSFPNSGSYRLHRLRYASPQTRMEQKVLWRVATNAELRKNYEISLNLGTGSLTIVENLLRVTFDIADDKI